ncbi:hypothetical protein DFH07DRAFT_950415 [Mycena maculata]|uniref:Uncharacterized protein n=1 Tax=Mycena maculata TaxID=230809 RepID=A0AAD7NXQ6_9AGAR|nr:hypothetical protein DFH07DRAFT_950415 [Mycena maculata]
MASCTAFCISPIVLGLGDLGLGEDAQITWADDDYARPEIIHVGLGFYSRFPEPDEADVVSDDDRGDPSPDISADSYPVKSCTSYGAPLRLRGGCHSDESGLEDGADESDEPESDSAGPSSKRKRKTVQPPRPRKRPSKGKGKASDDESDSETAIRVTLGGKNGTKGMFVDEESYVYDAPEFWDVPAHRVAIILDVSDTPECLQGDRKLISVDAYIKKQCQDAWTGPTGSKKTGLALVTILDEGEVTQCRRSNLKCNGFYTCSLASPDHLLGVERWDVESDIATQELISRPMFESKNDKGTDIVAIATAFYRSMTNQHCKAKGDGQFECGGHAVMRKYRTGKSSGKHHFIGCSNWSDGDGLSHRFTKIPPQVRESILQSLFRGEEITEEDTEVVEGYCSAIIHPSHLPRNKQCARIHYRDNKSVVGHLEAQTCPAELLILIPVDENDLRAVVIPKAGVPHNHPAFVRTKTPFQVAHKYKKAAEITGVIGQTTLRIDKAPSTRALLDGKLPQEIHPSMVNNRKRREILQSLRAANFPDGTGMKAVLREFEKDKSRNIGDRYIHSVIMQADMDIIITVNPDLAELVHDASWIMVDTTFAVVHGTTNEWKLLIWLKGLDKRTVIGRVWSNKATREAFVIVWNGIFEAIKSITGKLLNFKVFSKKSSLLGAIGDSEGAQAQGLGDVIILRQMNTPQVNGVPTVTVDSILLFIWKTCLVHFKRGVFKLEAHVDDYVFNCLLGFPYLETSEEIAAYHDFCQASTNPKVQSWWAHKISYPWLLPSLNRSLTQMSHLHWDLTPGDTNPIEGSHVQDNQVNHTNLTILEAVLSARAYDQETARIITASKASGVMENGNNSQTARFSAQARRQAPSRMKATEKASADGGKELRGKLRKSQQQIATRDAEIKRLQAEVDALQEHHRAPSPLFFVDSPPNSPSPIPRTRGSVNYHALSPVNDSPIAGPSRLPALDLISRPWKPRVNEPSSDFDYEAALKSDVLDTTIRHIAYGTNDPIDVPMYPVGNPDDDILASDPYTPS